MCFRSRGATARDAGRQAADSVDGPPGGIGDAGLAEEVAAYLVAPLDGRAPLFGEPLGHPVEHRLRHFATHVLPRGDPPVAVLVALLSYLMVSNVRYRTFKQLRLSRRNAAILAFLLTTFAALAVQIRASVALVVIASLYVILGLIEEVVFFRRRREERLVARAARAAAGSAVVDEDDEDDTD